MLLVTHVSDLETSLPLFSVKSLFLTTLALIVCSLACIQFTCIHVCYQLTQAIEQDLYLQ